ncbi:DUF2951 domain-containing protein [Staphylococcus sp. IVB6238]|uniref:DUF2951 domain-containing protein n=1 Tax=Staphylococcus sp. IVB6238 TaxID=2989770 RepID=UPI0021D20628|nr:DUF2951 domain-containing protein [Staphylococcus sp. IVB6238]UXR73288.1 DUF2951 domain-containing protein [Staphylococcus sp. IVB6238]
MSGVNLEGLKVKVDNMDEDIKELKKTITDHKRDTQISINSLTSTINMVKDNQADQKLINQKMDFTLDSINNEREQEEENKKERDEEMKKLKWYIFGLIGTLGSSLAFAAIRMFLGI